METLTIFYYPILENDVIGMFVKKESVSLKNVPDERLDLEEEWSEEGTVCHTQIIKKKINSIDEKIGFILAQRLTELKIDPFRDYPSEGKLVGKINHKYAIQNGYFIACADYKKGNPS